VWLRPERPARDRQLSRAAIVTVAVAVLDAEGAPGLSMRRVAAELEVTAGSLYWYVDGKDELLELAADHVIGEVDLPAAGSGEWRQALAQTARTQRAMLLRHPWAASVLSRVPNMGPNALRAADRTLATLAAAGFSPDLADAALAAVSNQVTGAVIAETAWRAVVTGPAATLGDWQREAAGYLAQITERYPHVAARLTAPAPEMEAASEARFDLALDCLLDGLRARLGSCL
jgi:AcrR family transcriptional regulator